MKTELNTIAINGVDYIRADSIQQKPAITGTRAIVVVDRGWIFAGNVERKDGRIILTDALHVFKWSTGGFSLLTSDPEAAKADLRAVADVEIPAASEIFAVPVPDNWGK